jgi:uncharacterized protein (DUF1330 family)
VPTLAPHPDQIAVVVARHPTGPVQMINLIKYRAHASYPTEYSGEASPECSGREAFQRFSAEAIEHLARVGARLVLLSRVDGVYIGEMAHDEWDDISIVEYPSVATVNDLASDPAFQAAVVHRTAALERYAIVATTALFDASSTS